MMVVLWSRLGRGWCLHFVVCLMQPTLALASWGTGWLVMSDRVFAGLCLTTVQSMGYCELGYSTLVVWEWARVWRETQVWMVMTR